MNFPLFALKHLARDKKKIGSKDRMVSGQKGTRCCIHISGFAKQLVSAGPMPGLHFKRYCRSRFWRGRGLRLVGHVLSLHWVAGRPCRYSIGRHWPSFQAAWNGAHSLRRICTIRPSRGAVSIGCHGASVVRASESLDDTFDLLMGQIRAPTQRVDADDGAEAFNLVGRLLHQPRPTLRAWWCPQTLH